LISGARSNRARALARGIAGLPSFASKNSRTVENEREFLGDSKAGAHRLRGGAAFRLAEARAHAREIVAFTLAVDQ